MYGDYSAFQEPSKKERIAAEEGGREEATKKEREGEEEEGEKSMLFIFSPRRLHRRRHFECKIV